MANSYFESTINVEAKFTTGSQAQFTVNLQLPEGFRPDKMIVHSPLYDDAAAIANPITLRCVQLKADGDLISFMRSNSAGGMQATPVSPVPQSFVNPPEINGRSYTFSCAQLGQVLSTLNGSLCFKITFIKYHQRSERDEAKSAKR